MHSFFILPPELRDQVYDQLEFPEVVICVVDAEGRLGQKYLFRRYAEDWTHANETMLRENISDLVQCAKNHGVLHDLTLDQTGPTIFRAVKRYSGFVDKLVAQVAPLTLYGDEVMRIMAGRSLKIANAVMASLAKIQARRESLRATINPLRANKTFAYELRSRIASHVPHAWRLLAHLPPDQFGSLFYDDSLLRNVKQTSFYNYSFLRMQAYSTRAFSSHVESLLGGPFSKLRKLTILVEIKRDSSKQLELMEEMLEAVWTAPVAGSLISLHDFRLGVKKPKTLDYSDDFRSTWHILLSKRTHEVDRREKWLWQATNGRIYPAPDFQILGRELWIRWVIIFGVQVRQYRNIDWY